MAKKGLFDVFLQVREKDAVMFRFLVVFVIPISIFSASIQKTMLPYMQYNPKATAAMLPSQYRFLKKAAEEIYDENRHKTYTILYFFSTSVPPLSYANYLAEVARFNREHAVQIDTTQALIGIDGRLKPYLAKTFGYLNGFENSHEKALVDIRLAPEVFEHLQIKVVPAIALAICRPHAHPSDCKVIALVRGEVSLKRFFELLDEKNLLPVELK